VDPLLNALTADPWAFAGEPPPSLADYSAEHAEFGELFERYRKGLLEEFQSLVPSDEHYSPVALQFNFPHNALVAIVVLALLATVPLPNLPLNALLSRPAPGSQDAQDAHVLAHSITGYAAAHPERRGDRRVLIVAYNPPLGLRSFARALSVLGRKATEPDHPSPLDQSSIMPRS
jgi:hypothetical protein